MGLAPPDYAHPCCKNQLKFMERFLGKKSLEKSNRNKANRFKKSIDFSINQTFSIDRIFQSIENFNRFVLPFNLPIIT